MHTREARPADRPAIRDVARRSMQASYSLGPTAIVGAVDEWYDENRLDDMLRDEEKVLLVAAVDGQVVGFSDSVRKDERTAEILWLHVDPDYRGEDVGVALYDATRERLADRGFETVHGRVLADNPGGNTFYRDQGLTKVGEEEVRIDGTAYLENVYADVDDRDVAALDVDGETVYVDHETVERGSIAPFHVVYTDEDGVEIFGYWCAKCGSLANAMDTMGRIQCDECGNARKPTRWDAAYL